ncbi:hypothetical protein ZOD2009_05027 [Haladaptatus paucihalophilus DX253]|uniref:DNA replication factor GINS n=1 Tax=Haladaptatus paucihalophilus DX253 TaxID=797209 RepID=E7QQD5_HALPU|nr:hypothetical protein [Haladaptatus paucihalophilus]EFW93199.1 hypothetical protein ZOD2009_05027 [Haladaptatus paucihalophilus DX253]SHK47711.1 DNA replication factor GINS [Haladaptatus paucihalophilus DX253]
MNLDELRSVQSKERSKDSLQHLRESFYADVGAYIRGLREERERAAERADDPFDSAEVNQLTDEIKTAEEVVEAVYERRVGKVVKRASLSAAGIPADEDGLTSEEQQLFADLVDRIESNKATVLDVLAGNEGSAESTASASTAPDTAAADPSARPSTASDAPVSDTMGTDTTASDANAAESEPDPAGDRPSDEAAAIAGEHDAAASSQMDESTPPEPSPPSEATAREPGEASAPDADAPDGPESSALSESSAPSASASDTGQSAESSDSDPADDRTTVRITRDVGSILGVDEREYDLETEDVVALPSENAGPLIERDAAEKLD